MVSSLLDEFAALQPQVPSPIEAGFVLASAAETYTCGGEDVMFNAQGALTKLGPWASTNHALLKLQYRQYSAADVASFFGSYCKSKAGWVQHDYGNPGLPTSVPGVLSAPTLTDLWRKPTQGTSGSTQASDSCHF